MGLENFNIAPDNKGGRKRIEDRDEGNSRKLSGRPYVRQTGDSEQWWIEAINSALGKTSIDGETVEEMEDEIAQLSSHTHSSPIIVWKQLDKHGIIEMDWEEYRDFYPDHLIDARVPGAHDVTGSKSSAPSWSSSVSEDSGLGSIINDAK